MPLDGGHMDVSMSPDASPETVAALQAIGQAAVNRMSITERDEMVCDRCHRRHGVVWFADSDLWNAVMREGDRGRPDEFSFCCPTCFMQLATERGLGSAFAVEVRP